MGEETKIGWCHGTFNPWRGCSHALFPPAPCSFCEGVGTLSPDSEVCRPCGGSGKAERKEHPGCLHCYAEISTPVRAIGQGWGPGAPRVVAAESTWGMPLKWARAAAEAGERRRVFFSLGDPLDEEAPKEAQARLWDLIRATSHVCSRCLDVPGRNDSAAGGCWCEGETREFGLDWLLLTKRPWRWEIIPEDVRPLVWLGTSVSDQATADHWLSALVKAQGFRLLFCSYEPALGPVDFSRWLAIRRSTGLAPWTPDGDRNLFHWLIWGGESGANRRPGEVSWGQAAADQCAAAGVPFYAKQDTAFRSGQQGRIPAELWARKEIPITSAA